MIEVLSKETIFSSALEKSSDETRTAYLDLACAGDADLRSKIDRLLDSHSRVGNFLERPVQELMIGASARSGEDGFAERDAHHFLTTSHRSDSLGRLEHYEILEVLGRGGMGVVFRAFDEKLQRVVAIKALAPELAAVGAARRRFVREAQCAAAVIHDNVIAIHAVDDSGPVPYLVMQFVDGLTLQEKLDRDGPMPVATILRLGMQIASGLSAAHGQSVVHRDVKPSNILLEHGSERIKIMDFGLARIIDDSTVSLTGIIAGTPAFMSPEQANGQPVDARSDLFSLGSVLYALGTGRAPFQSSTMMAVLKQVCESVPPPIRGVNPEFPEWLVALIDGLHAKEPAGRPQTAAEVAEMLGRHSNDLHEPVRIPAAPKANRRTATGWRIAAVLLALVLTGLAASEGTGLTDARGTIVRILRPDGTLVVEVDDPNVSVAIDGTDVVISGAGAKEIRLKPGEYRVQASKDGKVVQQVLVAISRDGRQIVRITKESTSSEAERWEQSVAGLPADKLVKAVALRLRELNPGFDGKVSSTVVNDEVFGLQFSTDDVDDISPLRSVRTLKSLLCPGSAPGKGKLADLSPLRGLALQHLECNYNRIPDLESLRGMPLTVLVCGWTRIADLSPLTGMRLTVLSVQETGIKDLRPIRGMPLKWLDLYRAKGVTDLSSIKELPLEYLNLTGLPVSDISLLSNLKSLNRLVLEDMPIADLSPLRGLGIQTLVVKRILATDLSPLEGMPLKRLAIDYVPEREPLLRSFPGLETINDSPAAEFWKNAAKK